jgi:L-threonylcarbamoyladenylate synthase
MPAIESLSSSTLPQVIQAVHPVITQGGIVALPTETFYGLGVDPFNREAVERLLAVKGRQDGKPILLLIGERTQLSSLVQAVSPVATFLMERFWPGPLTILFPALDALPSLLSGNTGKVGVRLTSCASVGPLLRAVGPLTGTSANRTGCPPARTAREVEDALGEDIHLIIDGGLTPGGAPSTIVDAHSSVRLIREGAVTRQMLRNVLETRGIALT